VASLLTTDRGARLFALGCHVGETVRLALGGRWEADDDDPRGEIDIRLPDGSVVRPVQRLMKRFANGPEDGVVGYATALGTSTAN